MIKSISEFKELAKKFLPNQGNIALMQHLVDNYHFFKLTYDYPPDKTYDTKFLEVVNDLNPTEYKDILDKADVINEQYKIKTADGGLGMDGGFNETRHTKRRTTKHSSTKHRSSKRRSSKRRSSKHRSSKNRRFKRKSTKRRISKRRV